MKVKQFCRVREVATRWLDDGPCTVLIRPRVRELCSTFENSEAACAAMVQHGEPGTEYTYIGVTIKE